MEEIADDTLGTLIDSFLAAARRSEGWSSKRAATARPTCGGCATCCAMRLGGRGTARQWHPTFINTRGERHPHDMGAEDVLQVRDLTLQAARQVVSVMRRTGIDGEWAGADP